MKASDIALYISRGLQNSRELFERTKNPEWEAMCNDYARLNVNKSRMSPDCLGQSIGILLADEINLERTGKRR